ncbi:MAG: UMP kinase [Alphaproteobacteria bacterium]
MFSSLIKPGARVLLKLSGEALAGGKASGLDEKTLQGLGGQIRFLQDKGLEVCLVVGGGNFFRGRTAEDSIRRTTADHMGMVATVLNGLALRDIFEAAGVCVTLMSALEIPSVVEPVCIPKALRLLAQKQVVIFAGGTGNPYFTTDTGAALRAIETECDVLLKGTQVDGIYSADPQQEAAAVFYPSLSYQDILAQKLQVMDLTAITLAQENQLPLAVFSLQSEHALQNLWEGKARFSWVS